MSSDHRHRIDKNLDTLLANQPFLDGEAIDHCQKVTSQDGGLTELTVARSCLTITAKQVVRDWLRRSRTWSEITNDVVDVSSAVT